MFNLYKFERQVQQESSPSDDQPLSSRYSDRQRSKFLPMAYTNDRTEGWNVKEVQRQGHIIHQTSKYLLA